MKIRPYFYSFLFFVALLALLELGVRAVYFQTHSGSNSGIILLSEKAAKFLALRFSPGIKTSLTDEALFERHQNILFEKEGEELLHEFQERYRTNFLSFVETSKALQARLFFLYIPSSRPIRGNFSYSRFFSSLAREAGIPFVDMSSVFAKYRFDQITLEPEDPHLSRFGNQLVAEVLASQLKEVKHRSPVKFSSEDRPGILGDVKPNNSTIWEMSKPIPFLGGTNGQGLRNHKEFSFPKQMQRILCVGDSFTFGLYVSPVHTFPYLLEKSLSNVEVVNAGKSGYTMEDEASLLRDRAKFLEPDIIILQAYDNDLTDQFSFQRRIFARKRGLLKEGPAERKFLDSLRSRK